MSDEERLPITFFEPRKIDESRVEGGGGNESKWVLEDEELQTRARLLSSQFDMLLPDIDAHMKKNTPTPYVMLAKMDGAATAKSRRSDIVSFLSPRGQDSVIGLIGDRSLVVRVDNLADATRIATNLASPQRYAEAITCLSSIEEFSPLFASDTESEAVRSYKVKLIDFQDYELNQTIIGLFEQHLKDTGLSFTRSDYGMPMPVYKVPWNEHNDRQVALDAMRSGIAGDALFSLEPMPVVSLSLDSFDSDMTIPLLQRRDGERYETLGILDSGVAPIEHLAPWLAEGRETPYPGSFLDPTHGTFVAGVSLYGDRFAGESFIGHHGIQILDAAIFPDPRMETIEEDELIENIREVIRRHHERVRVWNLSISMVAAVDDSRFSDFGMALDSIQGEYNVLICKSAGNTAAFMRGQPRERINQGADSVRALVVGSVAYEQGPGDLAKKDNPSPFSRIGPGPEFIIKPEVSHYGGNAQSIRGNLKTSGVTSFAPDGGTTVQAGTSFSTPRVASLATSLYQELDPQFDSLLLKALIVHSAAYGENLEVPENERTKELGFGVPKSTQDILYTNPHEITLIMRTQLAKGQYLDIKDFPMPKSLIRDGYYTGQIVTTLVYDPILDPTQGLEYCQSNIDIKMGTYAQKIRRDTERRSILNPIGREGSQNILLDGHYSRRKLKEDSSAFARRERQLIKYGDKYYPVKKYAVDLSNMTPGDRQKYLGGDRHWYLYLRGLYRNHIDRVASVDQSLRLAQEVCVVITVKDPFGEKRVYDDVTQSLDANNFWHNTIRISQRAAVRGN